MSIEDERVAKRREEKWYVHKPPSELPDVFLLIVKQKKSICKLRIAERKQHEFKDKRSFTSEFIPVECTRVVGPLPKGMEYVNGYAGALPPGAPDAAKAYLSFLASPPSKAVFKRFGLE